MVSAFEQSLYTMTNRIQQLIRLSNEKEVELNQTKLLISKLLEIDDIKQNEIELLLNDLNKDEIKENTLKDKNLNTSKQLVRRHTFTADEIDRKLSKCKSLETCAKLESSLEQKKCSKKTNAKKSPKTQYDSNGQIFIQNETDKNNWTKNENCESSKQQSTWLKLTKAFKKSSLSKYSPMHRPSNSDLKTSDKNNTKKPINHYSGNGLIYKSNEESMKSNQLNDDDEDLLVNLSSNLCNLVSNVPRNLRSNLSNKVRLLDDEHLNLRKEFVCMTCDEKERQLCDLRLETLTNAHQIANLKEFVNKIVNENEHLNRLIKEKSSLMSSKASLFSVNSSVAESMGNTSICNISLSNTSNLIGTANNSLSNTNSLSNPIAILQSPSSVRTNTLSLATSISTIDPQPNLIPLNSSISNESNLKTNSLNTINLEISNTRENFNSSSDNSSKVLINEMNCEKNQLIKLDENCESNDSLLKEGKLVNIQLNLWNENCIAQNQFNNRIVSDQMHSLESSFETTNKSNALSNKIGLLRISKKTNWLDLNQNLKKTITNYLNIVDPNQTLGINLDSFCSFEFGDLNETFYLDKSEARSTASNDKQPYDYLTDDLIIRLKCKSMIESFALQTLIPKSVLLRLINLLSDKKRLIIAGPSKSNKTYIAHKLAEYLIVKLNEESSCSNRTGFQHGLSESSSLLSADSSSNSFKLSDSSSNDYIPQSNLSNNLNETNELKKCTKIPVGSIASYCINAQNYQNLYHYLNSLVQQCDQQQNNQQIDYRNVPSILIIDNLQFVSNIDETFSPFLQLKNSTFMPYIICTLNQGKDEIQEINQSSCNQSCKNVNIQCSLNLNRISFNAMAFNLQLSNNFRWFTFNNSMSEPTSGQLSRFLRKKVIANLIEQKLNYLSEFNLLEIDEKYLKKQHSKDQSLKSLLNVLTDLDSKKIASINLIDWLDQVLKHINHFIEMFSTNSNVNEMNSPLILGSCILTDCPINDLDKTKNWFDNCWNNLIAPYLIRISKNEFKQTSNIEDPSIWIIKTYPFNNLSFNESSENRFRSQLINKNVNLKKIYSNDQSNQHTQNNTKLDPFVNALNNLNSLTKCNLKSSN